MRFLIALAWRTDRRRLLVASALMGIGYLSTPFLGVLLKGLTDVGGLYFGLGAAALLVSELMLGHFAHLYYFELGERMGARLNLELVDLTQARLGLEHFDDPAFNDTLALVRQDIALTRQGLEGVLHLGGLLLRATVTTVILTWVNPWLALLPLAAVPPMFVARRAQRILSAAREARAAQTRLAAHFVELATSADAVKEVRVFGAAPFLMARQREAWRESPLPLLRSAAVRASGQLLFAFAYGLALFLVLRQATAGTATLGDVVLVITLAVQISVQVAGALGLMSTLQAAAKTADRLGFLRAFPATENEATEGTGPIRLEGVGFAYPSGETVLRDITLTITPGTVVAIVGENGAGKSTLVKLLCGLYQPTTGTITPRLPLSRLSLLFQDFARLQLLLRENVGVGDLGTGEASINAALDAANASSIVERVGLDGLLGRDYGDGHSLSGGQWQSLGLARTLMRREPLLLALDEPAAALDAQAEHALFERFAAAAPPDAITVFVSHRFSTVRMADLIVVLKDGRIAELGSHADLLSLKGLYAELFGLQARVYR